jgi:uncharacterized membrane protein YdjX (TVP38/TMEM64 family)
VLFRHAASRLPRAALPASRSRALFGIVRGTLYVLIAATIGAIGAFLLARYAARGAIERRLARHARFVAIDYAGAWSGRSCS